MDPQCPNTSVCSTSNKLFEYTFLFIGVYNFFWRFISIDLVVVIEWRGFKLEL